MTPLQQKQFFQKAKLIALAISIILPLIVLIGFGVYAVINSEIAIYVFLATTAITSICFFIFLKLNARENKVDFAESITLKGLAEPSQNWSRPEVELWERLREETSELVQENGSWDAVSKVHSIALAEQVAEFYGRKNKFDVTSIEALIALEEISKRFRKILRKNVPLIEQLTFSHIVTLLDFKSNYAPHLSLYTDIVLTIKSVGKLIVNPAGQALDSVQQKIIDQVKEQLGVSFNGRLKATFLEECTSVYIDLFSGRFAVANDEVKQSKLAEDDNKNLGIELEPVRIAIVGQLSAGKSSLTNLICRSLVAEVDHLPSTDKSNIYSASIENEEQLKIVDLPGLDNTKEAENETFKQIINSDVVLWVLRANQQARKQDKELFCKITDYYVSNPNRKMPKIIGVFTHVDKIVDLKIGEFKELFDDSNERIILNDLLDYNRSILSFDDFTFIAKSKDGKVIGLTELSQYLSNTLEEAKQAQFNRRRLDSNSQNFTSQIRRLFTGTSAVGIYFKGD
jgi:GTPase Era involved in 16S rRNA processing